MMATPGNVAVPVTATLPGALHSGMVEACAFAVKLLDIMVDDKDGHPRAADVANCHGLAFLEASKGGLGFTVAKGHGFIIKNLGNGVFSAPAFFDVTQRGIGLAAGHWQFQSMVVLKGPQLMQELCYGPVSRHDGHLTVGPMSGPGTASNAFGHATKLEPTRDLLYSTTQGLALPINVAITSTEIVPDGSLNKQLHGIDTKLADVLSGMAYTFEELAPLRDKLLAIQATSALQGLAVA